MTLPPGLTIFIPVYNEESLLTPNVMRLIKFLENLAVPYEIILGSNGSTDKTTELAKKLCEQHPRVRFFHLAQKGVGTAFKNGVVTAKYERIITVDMDLSINLGFIRESYQSLSQCDIVIGSKISGSQKRAKIRKMASNCFIRLAKILLKIDFHDYSIAAKGYRKKLVENYLHYIDPKTFYVVKIVYHATREGKRLKEIPVQCVDERESRFNLIHEGVYKFGNLFLLWLSVVKGGNQ